MLPILLTCFILSACGSGGNNAINTGLTPLPKSNDLKDEVLIDAITNFITVRNAPPNSAYDFIRIDLNGDGKREGIVLFKLPHTYWCGWDGCVMAVFKAGAKKFTPMSIINSVRGPIYVSATGNNGWRDIIIRTSGANMPDKNVIMAFNGRSYPNTPLLAPTLRYPLSSMRIKIFFK